MAYAGGWGFQLTCNAGAAVLVAAFLVAKPLRNLRIATVPEFFRKRYNNDCTSGSNYHYYSLYRSLDESCRYDGRKNSGPSL